LIGFNRRLNLVLCAVVFVCDLFQSPIWFLRDGESFPIHCRRPFSVPEPENLLCPLAAYSVTVVHLLADFQTLRG
jgi:hypothetical protein